MNKKQFETDKEFNDWIVNWEYEHHSFEEMIYGYDEDADMQKMLQELLDMGYDLDDLVADGHAYSFGGHKNNGWLYEDEADKEYLEMHGIQCELRKRA